MKNNREKIHVFRVIPILLIIFATIANSVVLCFFNRVYWDEMICIGLLGLLFVSVFIFELEFERKHYGLAYNRSTTFSRVAAAYIFCCMLCELSMYIPEFFRPFMLLPLIMCAFSNEVIAFCSSMYLMLIFILASGGDFYEVVCYCISIVFSVILAKALSEKTMRIYIAAILLFLNEAVSVAFYYLANESVEYKVLIYGACNGVVLFLFAAFFYGRMRGDSSKELDNRLLDITSDDYSAVVALRNDFPGEYRHAKKVADVAYRCAKEIGLDAHLAEAAGFYYRIGKWQGEPHVPMGVDRAIELCFPVELVEILSEYYGEETALSSPISALVHMVDSLSIKLEAMSKDVGLSTWNQEMIIYQTLNEYSSMGLYDQSGLSMNQFLKARELLAKEKWTR